MKIDVNPFGATTNPCTGTELISRRRIRTSYTQVSTGDMLKVKVKFEFL